MLTSWGGVKITVVSLLQFLDLNNVNVSVMKERQRERERERKRERKREREKREMILGAHGA